MSIILKFQSRVAPLTDNENARILQLAQCFNKKAELTMMNAVDCLIINAGIRKSKETLEYFFTINKQRTRSGVYQYIVSSQTYKNHAGVNKRQLSHKPYLRLVKNNSSFYDFLHLDEFKT